MGDSAIFLIDFIELLFDWTSAAMLAEYDVYMKRDVKKSMDTTTRMDPKVEVELLDPKNMIILSWASVFLS